MTKHLVGNLKPDKVKQRKLHSKVIEITPAGTGKLNAMKAVVPIKNNV